MEQKKLFLMILMLTLVMNAVAQENQRDSLQMLEQRVTGLEKMIGKLQNFKVSGYIQGQYQNGQWEALSLKVGDKVHLPSENYNRIGIRRGRIKFAYEKDIYLGVFQIDITERGVGFKDVYFQVKDPWIKSMALKVGVFNRPFGYEIGYSSALRESPERSTIIQTLFPDERDLGAALVLQAPKSSKWSILKLEGGLFAGNGIKLDNDNKKDFIGHLSASNSIGSWGQWGAGFSYYRGSVCNPTDSLFVMNSANTGFEGKQVERYSYEKREYFGLDGRFAVSSVLGMTQLRGEYIWGTQPGSIFSTKSPNYPSLAEYLAFLTKKEGGVTINGLYSRLFSGFYVIFIQDIGNRIPLSVVAKYDSYMPNTKLKTEYVGTNASNSSYADLKVDTWGFGLIWRISQCLKATAYYEMNQNAAAMNATTVHSDIYNHDRRDNVFTFRLQYKF